MKHANYQRISKCYDENEIRQNESKDDFLDGILTGCASAPVRVLDLACGTGTYLKAQCDAFADAPVEWHGFDAFDAMLTIARQKAPDVAYAQGTAEDLPYADNFFDVVTCHFAFHHFPEKARTLAQIRRVLKDGGHIKLSNIAPEEMQGWWIYTYFPACVEIDQDRFWPYTQMYRELESLKFSVTCTVNKTLSRTALDSAQRHAMRRDCSQLDILDDAKYHQGLQRIEQDLENGVETRIDEIALIIIIGQKLS